MTIQGGRKAIARREKATRRKRLKDYRRISMKRRQDELDTKKQVGELTKEKKRVTDLLKSNDKHLE